MDYNKQDDKNKHSNIKGSRAKISDPQAINYIKTIITQIIATNNPAELHRLVSAIRSIKSNNSFINDIAEEVETIALKKQEAAEKQLNSEIMQRELIELAQQARDADLQMHKDIIEQKKNALISINNQFTQTINKSTENYKMRTNSLKDINVQLNRGVPIDDSKLDHLIFNKEEMNEIKKMYEQSKEIHNHYKEIHEADKLLQANLELLNEKLKSENLSHLEKQELMKDVNLIQEKIIEHKPLVSLVDKMYKENKELMALRQSELKKYGQAIDEFGQIVKEQYPENKGLKNHHTVLKGQHNKIAKEYKLIGSDLDNHPASQLVAALTSGKKVPINLKETKALNGFVPSTLSVKLNKNDKNRSR